MTGVLAGFTIVGIVILIGYVAGQLRIGGSAAPQTLPQVTFFVTNPASNEVARVSRYLKALTLQGALNG